MERSSLNSGRQKLKKGVIKMRYSTIIEKLSTSGSGAVYPEEYRKDSQTRFRLWTLVRNFPDPKKPRNVFPSLEYYSLLIKLGEYVSIAVANNALARAREKGSLPVKLFLLPPKRQAAPKSKPFGIRRQTRRKVVTF